MALFDRSGKNFYGNECFKTGYQLKRDRWNLANNGGRWQWKMATHKCIRPGVIFVLHPQNLLPTETPNGFWKKDEFDLFVNRWPVNAQTWTFRFQKKLRRQTCSPLIVRNQFVSVWNSQAKLVKEDQGGGEGRLIVPTDLSVPFKNVLVYLKNRYSRIKLLNDVLGCWFGMLCTTKFVGLGATKLVDQLILVLVYMTSSKLN